MPTKTKEPLAITEITIQTLPEYAFKHLGWNPRITKYYQAGKPFDKVRADEHFAANPGPVHQVANLQFQEIGSHGTYESGILNRIVEVTTPKSETGYFPDLLGEVFDDKTEGAPLEKWASPELRARFDRLRFEFGEYGLIGDRPTLAGHKARRDQIRIINLLSRAVAGNDKALAKAIAAVLADNIENLEPSAEL